MRISKGNWMSAACFISLCVRGFFCSHKGTMFGILFNHKIAGKNILNSDSQHFCMPILNNWQLKLQTQNYTKFISTVFPKKTLGGR